MIISVNWLRKYLGQKVDIDQLTERIGSRLVEIESVAPLADKYRSPVIVKVVDCVPHPDSDHMHVCQIDDGSYGNAGGLAAALFNCAGKLWH